MAIDDDNLVQIGLEIDIPGLERSLSDAEKALQQGVQKFTGLGGGGNDPIGAPQAGAPIGSQGQAPSRQAGLDDARNELQQIRQYAEKAPDIAMSAISGQGGLAQRVLKFGAGSPEEAEQAQELVREIKALTQSLKETSKGTKEGGEPAVNMLALMRNDMRLRALSMVGNDITSGNLISAAGGGIGGALGMAFGGPAGAMAGATIGQTIAAPIQGLVNASGEAQQYQMQVADISARFGDFGLADQDSVLDVDRFKRTQRFGYSMQDTASLLDALREQRVILQIDDEAQDLASQIQGLTRAMGLNTEAVVASFGEYRRGGGEMDANAYMSQMLSGAIATGMQQNMGQYIELVGSARSNLVNRTFQQDQGDTAMGRIQSLLVDMMGGKGGTADLLRDNPGLAQQMLQGFLQTGGAQQYSFDSTAMQLAGVERGRTDSTFLNPQQQVDNAIKRQGYVFNQFLGGGALDRLGFSDVGQLQQAVGADPDYLRRAMSAENPNSEQAASLQDLFNQQFRGQYGRLPSAAEFQTFTQLGTASLLNNGQIGSQTVVGDGETLGELYAKATQTEGQLAREASEERHAEMMAFLEKFADSLTAMNEGMAALIRLATAFAVAMGIGAEHKDPASAVPTYGGGIGLGETASGIPRTPDEAGSNFQNNLSRGYDRKLEEAGLILGWDEESNADIIGNIGRDPSSRPTFAGVGSGIEVLPGIPLPRRGSAPSTSTTIDLNNLLGGDRPHASFNDTPEAGVLARPGFNVFEFAYGDTVHASQGGNTTIGDSSVMNQFTVQVHVHGADDPTAVENSARRGAESGLDAFRANAAAVAAMGNNQPRIRGKNY